MGAFIGLLNGLLVTYLRVQAFVVTLCGMFVYRGLARWIAADQNTGLAGEFGDWKEALASNLFGVPIHLVILLGLLAMATLVLHLQRAGPITSTRSAPKNERAARVLRHRDRRLQDPRVRPLLDADGALLRAVRLYVQLRTTVGHGEHGRAIRDRRGRARRVQPARRRRDGARRSRRHMHHPDLAEHDRHVERVELRWSRS